MEEFVIEPKIRAGMSIWESVKIILIIIGFQILGGLVFGILIVIIELSTGVSISPSNAYGLCIIEIIGYILTYRIINKRKRYKLEFSKKINFKGMTCILFTLIGYILVSANSTNLMILKLFSNKQVGGIIDGMMKTPFGAIVFMVIIAPFFEELFMRGIILEQLSKRLKPSFAIFISALLFGILHLNISQGVNALLLGIILGYVYLKTRNLTLSIILHGSYNILVIVLAYVLNENKMIFSLPLLVLGTVLLIVSLYLFNKFNSYIIE